MKINDLREKVFDLLRWKIQDKAYHSRCSAKVLFGAAQQLVPAGEALGYEIKPPLPEHDETYYKDWITKVTNTLIDANHDYKVNDGGMTNAKPFLDDAVRRIRDCSPTLAELPPEAVVVRPIEDGEV